MSECKDCRFFKAPRNSSMGVCRRHPPVIISKGYTGARAEFPPIANNEWCGEFKQAGQQEFERGVMNAVGV